MTASDEQHLILGLGTGRCGTHALAQLLNQQAEAHVTHEEPPLLPWKPPAGSSLIQARLARFRRTRQARVVGDVASFYLPYLEEALTAEPRLVVICLQRPCEEVVASFCRWLDTVHPLPINHWAQYPEGPWSHDPVWTRIFPQYDIQDRQEGIRRYWEECHERIEALAKRFPERIHNFATDEALNTEAGQRAVLSLAGIPKDQQTLALGVRTHQADEVCPHPRRQIAAAAVRTDDLPPKGGTTNPGRCAVLVPYGGQIVPDCERGLKELERRGYAVRRVRGYAAIDQGRNQMASDALIEGFEETMWIDSDIGFDPDDVERLRAHGEPIVCGLYPQKGRRALACHLLPGTSQLIFGQGGGLQEILYAGAGFLLVRREVYLQMQLRLELPVCNERFDRPTLPFFQPLTQPSDDGFWYLAEDYSFCERARQCGYKVLADTTIRLWHVGQYAYGWEDAGVPRQRYDQFTYRIT